MYLEHSEGVYKAKIATKYLESCCVGFISVDKRSFANAAAWVKYLRIVKRVLSLHPNCYGQSRFGIQESDGPPTLVRECFAALHSKRCVNSKRPSDLPLVCVVGQGMYLVDY